MRMNIGSLASVHRKRERVLTTAKLLRRNGRRQAAGNPSPHRFRQSQLEAEPAVLSRDEIDDLAVQRCFVCTCSDWRQPATRIGGKERAPANCEPACKFAPVFGVIGVQF
jgi:hypothetical protein